MTKKLNMMVGPPLDKSMDEEAVKVFSTDADAFVACGGITSRVVSTWLGKELELEAEYFSDGLMSYGYIGNVIATEGVVTLCAVARYLEGTGEYPSKSSGAEKILQLFEQADLVRIVFGTSVNDEHDGELAFEYKEASLYSIKDKLEALGKKVEIIKF